MRAVAEFAVRCVGVVQRRPLAVNAGGILALFLAVALAAVDGRHFFRMRQFLDAAVAGNAIDAGVGRSFQGGRMEAWRHSGLALPNLRAGIMAAGALLGTRCRRLLAVETGGQEGRNGSEPECVHGRHGVVFFNKLPVRGL